MLRWSPLLAYLATVSILTVSATPSAKILCHFNFYSPALLPAASSTYSGESKFGYLFIFFKDETEQINAGLSVGNDALNYTLYHNGSTPILTSSVGSKHTRDPFLVRSPDKSRNWIIATDNSLKMWQGDEAQRHASRSITIYESNGATLTSWKPARLSVPLLDSCSGGVSAPEAYWDEAKGKYFVIFGSNKFQANDTAHSGSFQPSIIYYTYTSDFETFEQPAPYYFGLTDDDGTPTNAASDMTITPLGQPGEYVRFFRDDTNGTLKVRGQTTYEGLFGKWSDIDTNTTYVSSEGLNGGPLVFHDNIKAIWHVFIDRFVGGYEPYESTDLHKGSYQLSDAPSFPKDVKQGNVVSLTASEYDELRSATFTMHE